MAKTVIIPIEYKLDPEGLQRMFDSLEKLQDSAKDLGTGITKSFQQSAAQAEVLTKAIDDVNDTKALDKIIAEVEALTEAQKKNVSQANKIVKASESQAEAFVLLNAEIKRVREEKDKLIETQEQTILFTKGETAAAKENKKRYDELTKEVAKLTQKEGILNEVKKKSKQSFDLANKAAIATKGSYNDLSAATNLLTNRYRSFVVGIDGTQAELNKLAEAINNNKNKLKEMDKSIGDNFRNVGNYEGALNSFFGELSEGAKDVGAAAGAFGGFGDVLGDSAGKLRTVASGLLALKNSIIKTGSESDKAKTKAQKFGTALKGLALTGVAVALGSIASAMTNVQSASEDAQVASAKLGGALDVIKGRAASFGVGLINGVVNTAKAVKSSFEDIGDGNFFTQSDKTKELGAKAGSAFVKGVTDAVGNDLGGALEKAMESSGVVKSLEIALKKLRRIAIVELAEFNAAFAVAAFTAGDESTGFKRRIEAAREAGKAQVEAAEKSLEIAKLEEDILNEKVEKKNKAGIFDDLLLDQQADAIAARIALEAELEVAQKERINRVEDIQIAAVRNELDFISAAFADKKAILDEEITNEKNSFAVREKALADLQAATERVAKSEVAAFDEFVDQQIDINELLSAQTEEQLFEKVRAIGLGKRLEKELLDVLKIQLKARRDLTKSEKDLADQRLKLEEDLADALNAVNIELIKEEKAQQLAKLKLSFETRKKDAEIKFGALEDRAKLNALLLKLDKEFLQEEAELKKQFAIKEEQAAFEKGNLLTELDKVKKQNDIIESTKAGEKREKELSKIEIDALKESISQLGDHIETKTKLEVDTKQDELALAKLQQQLLLEEQKKGQNKLLAEARKFAGDSIALAIERAKALSQAKEEQLSQDIDKQKDNVDRQRELADKGLENTLAFEDRKQVELEERRLKEQQKQQKLDKLQTFFTLLREYAKENPNTAAAKALAQLAIADAIAARLETGTDYTLAEHLQRKGKGGGIDSTGMVYGRKHTGGGVLVEMEANEGLLSGKDMAKIGSRENWKKMRAMIQAGDMRNILDGQSLRLQSAVVPVVDGRMLMALYQVRDQIGRIDNTKYINRWDTYGNLIRSEIKNGFERERSKTTRIQ